MTTLCKRLPKVLAGMAAFLTLSTVSMAGEVRFDGEGHAYNPVFSLDGKYIAFEVNRYAGDIDLFVSKVSGDIAADASKVKLPGGSNPFGGSGQVVVNPSWHPQGVLVFEGSNQGGQYRLYYQTPGGGQAAEMISSQQVAGDLTFPVISPSGLLGFISDATGQGDIRTYDNNTAKIGHVTKMTGSEVFPYFSKDGARLLYTRKERNTEDVFLVNTDGTGDTPVAGGGGDQSRPIFANGKIVFFDSSRGEGIWDVASVETPGGSKTIEARAVRLPLRSRPAISPDGQWLAFSYDDPSKQNKVVIKNLQDGRTVDVSTSFKACGEPTWAQQGDRTLLGYTALPQSGSDWRFLTVTDVTDKL
jgi:Tol biopolymer transport system component